MRITLSKLFIFCLLIFSKTYAQYFDWNTAQRLDDSVFIKAKDFYKTYYKDNLYVGDQSSDGATVNVSYFYADYLQGNLYASFLGYEDYVRRVLKQIIKDDKLTNNIKIYFYREPDFNATMDALGNLRINVGLFNYINTEAELAGVLAHEFAHFYNKDGLEKRNYENALFGGIPNISYQKTQEASADFLAIKYIKDSPYSLKGMASDFKTLKRFEIKASLKGHLTLRRITHPDPGDRLKQVKYLSNDSVTKGKKNFVVDSLSFMNLKKAATHESYKILLEDCDFKELIERSFTAYLYKPNDQENLSILLESLKRYLLHNPADSSRQFILSFYKSERVNESGNYKYISYDSTSILKYLNKGLLHLQSNDLSKLPKNELLDTVNIKFRTNNEAFSYFYKKAKEMDCKPCLFTAQYDGNNKLIYNKEVPYENSIFDCRNYVSDMASGTKYNNTVCVINLPTLFFYEYMRDYSHESLKVYLDKLSTALKETTGFDKIYFINDLSLKEQNNLKVLDKIIESTVSPGFYYFSVFERSSSVPSWLTNGNNSKTEEVNWLKTTPESYDFFKAHNAKSIYFVTFDYLVVDPQDYPAMVGAKRLSRSWKFKKISIEEPTKVTYSHNIIKTTKTLDESLKECAIALKWYKAMLK